MTTPFEKMIHALKKRGIQLDEFQDYLWIAPSFSQWSQFFTQQGIKLKEFKTYLDQLSATAVTKSQHLPRRFSSQKALSLAELESFKAVGLKLLSDGKIKVPALNSLIINISGELSLRSFLQQLLKERIIKAKEFLGLEQGEYPEIQDVELPYQMRKTATGVEFFVKIQQGAKEFRNYQILGELGRGGMGIVYKAFHTKLQQIFALKVLIAGEAATEKTLKRFHREVQSMAKLKHPGIIQIIDSGQEGGQHYFAMEYVEGKTLDEKMKTGLSVRESVQIIKKALVALQYAHSQKIIHRDLKPENIFITSEGEPKIGDFGLAKDMNASTDSQKLTMTGAILGTAIYMSPEQARGEIHKLDARTDIYSMGVCLYQLLTQQLPFQGQSLNVLLKNIIQEEPLAPSKLKAGIHRDLDVIILKTLDKTRGRRYQTAKQFAADLERFLGGYPIHARLANRSDRFIKWGRRNRQRVLISVVFGIGLFILFGAIQFTKYRQQQQSFNTLYHDALQAEALFDDSSTTLNVKPLLNALNFLNRALAILPRHKEAELKKWTIGVALISVACKREEYLLAEYVAKEVQALTHFSSKEKNTLIEKIEEEKIKISQKHQKEFANWIALLKSGNQKAELQQDAIFAIIKMKEPEIFQQLLSLSQKGTNYFLTTTSPKPPQVEFFNIIIRILGRMKNEKARKPLLLYLRKLKNHLIPLPVGGRPLYKVNYMVLVAKALSNFKNPKDTELFGLIRFEMSQESLFWKRTEKAYRKLLENQENQENHFPIASTASAFVKFAQGDFDGAIQEFDQMIRKNPTDLDAYRNRGMAKRAKGDYDGAILDYNRAIELNPVSFGSYNDRGICKKAKGDFVGAMEDYNKVLSLNPNFVKGYNNRGNLKWLLKDHKGAIKDFDKAIKLNPQYMDAYFNRGINQSALGNFKKGIADFSNAISLNPQYFEAFNARGNAKADLGDVKGAFHDYEKAIHINPRFPDVFSNRGLLKQALGDHNGAIADHSEAIRIDPKMAKAYFNRGVSKQMLGKLEEAIYDYNQSIDLDSSLPDVFNNRGSAKKNQKDFEGAIKDFNAALRLNPKYSDAYFNRGNAKQLQGDLKGALKDYDLAIQFNPKDVLCFYSRALIKQATNDLEGAIKDYNKTIKLNPEFAEAYLQRGNAKAGLGQLDGAISDCKKALSLNSQLVDAFYSIGVLMHAKGDLKGAKRAFQKFLHQTRGLENTFVQEARQFIYQTFPGLKK